MYCFYQNKRVYLLSINGDNLHLESASPEGINASPLDPIGQALLARKKQEESIETSSNPEAQIETYEPEIDLVAEPTEYEQNYGPNLFKRFKRAVKDHPLAIGLFTTFSALAAGGGLGAAAFFAGWTLFMLNPVLSAVAIGVIAAAAAGVLAFMVTVAASAYIDAKRSNEVVDLPDSTIVIDYSDDYSPAPKINSEHRKHNDAYFDKNNPYSRRSQIKAPDDKDKINESQPGCCSFLFGR